MTTDGTPSYTDRIFLAYLRHPLSKPLAQRAVHKAARLLSLPSARASGICGSPRIR